MKVKHQNKTEKLPFKALKYGDAFLIPSMPDCNKYPFLKLPPQVHFSGWTPLNSSLLIYKPVQAISLITGLPSEVGEEDMVILLPEAKFLPFGVIDEN